MLSFARVVWETLLLLLPPPVQVTKPSAYQVNSGMKYTKVYYWNQIPGIRRLETECAILSTT